MVDKRYEKANVEEKNRRLNDRLSNAKRYIWTTFEKVGIHCYPAAAWDLHLEKVKYLSLDHRHLFKFKVQISVTHNDREIEFILLKEWLESLYSDKVLQLNHKSCEMMAEELFGQINDKYPSRNVIIDVSEDGENGAHVEFLREE
jgi:hypothetical protein